MPELQLYSTQEQVQVEVSAQERLKRYLDRQQETLHSTKLMLAAAKDNQKYLEDRIGLLQQQLDEVSTQPKARVKSAKNPSNATRKRATELQESFK